MSLSLEVKKFINSEHTGDFVSVVLPSELPVERAEVREVNRDKSAANSARNVADNKTRLAAKAKEKAESTLKARNAKQAEYEEASRMLASLKSKRDGLKPDLDKKRVAYESAHDDFELKNAAYKKASDAYAEAEAAFNAASEAENAAVLTLNERRAQKSGAEEALSSAREGGLKNEGELSNARSETEHAQALFNSAQAAFEEAAKKEGEKDAEYKVLANSVAQLLAMQKNEAKRSADCQMALAAAAKELTKASKQIAEGDLQVSLETKSKDEVGALAVSMQQTVDCLRAYMERISDMAYTDPLTGVKSKAAYDEQVKQINENIQTGFAQF